MEKLYNSNTLQKYILFIVILTIIFVSLIILKIKWNNSHPAFLLILLPQAYK